ncbi:MAG: hypothetical protein OEZ14_14320, partial [Acidimicrobiia bacterium]|nr:hypothetical protein [Acidimicrobiia bacterium]
MSLDSDRRVSVAAGWSPDSGAGTIDPGSSPWLALPLWSSRLSSTMGWGSPRAFCRGGGGVRRRGRNASATAEGS